MKLFRLKMIKPKISIKWDNSERFPEIDKQVIFYANEVASEYTYDYSVGTSLGTLIRLEKVHSAKMSDTDELALYYYEAPYSKDIKNREGVTPSLKNLFNCK